ncbi:hypothetical protein GGS20DRAFT_194570 [Poronia punctata]|nr:hypothetical protein GGS20DRAFT_194570 [Poronia punctata]
MPDPKEHDIAGSFISHLRNAARLQCPVCSLGIPATDERLRNHFETEHPAFIEGKDVQNLVRDLKRGRALAGNDASGPTREPPSRDAGGGVASPSITTGGAVDGGSSYHDDKKVKSPGGARPRSARPRSTSPGPKRSRARHQPTTPDPDFLRRGVTQQGKLWNPDEERPLSTSRPKSFANPLKSVAQITKSETPAEENNDDLWPFREPNTRPISQEQLVSEVKGIYAGLLMVESKCIEVDNAQSNQTETKLNNEQWQALIALHRTLLHEHHDFFLASQHPSASPPLKRLAAKYAMPARMWRHGIHSFLELLRHRLPTSLEHMLTFIYLAYSMMALLYETVPAFEDTWIECLGDLGRYRMAIEDEDIRDREVWTSVSRNWYSKASDKAPTTGRLYHHLAILARPNALQQLFYYVKSLCVPVPFPSTKESIMTLFDPVLSVSGYQHARLSRSDVAFVKAHAILFSKKQMENYHPIVHDFLDSLDGHIERVTQRWVEAGYYIAIANCCALLSYGSQENAIARAIRDRDQDQDEGQQDEPMDAEVEDAKPSEDLENALKLVMGTHEIVFQRQHDTNILPYTHVVMVFMFYLVQLPTAMHLVGQRFPWKRLSLMLNSFLESYQDYDRSYHPPDLFSNAKIDDDEKYFEMPSMMEVRKERILWLAHKIARTGSWLTWDDEEKRFGVNIKYEKETDLSKDVNMMNISSADNSESQAPTAATHPPDAGEVMDVDNSREATTSGAM